MINIILGKTVNFNVSDLAPNILLILKSIATYLNPAWIVNKKQFFSNSEDRYLYSFRYSSDKTKIFFSRGLLDKILQVLKVNNIDYKIIDIRTCKPLIQVYLKETESLFNYQKKALDQLTSNDEGILIADCGSGKTVIGSAIISRIQQPTLIVVTTLELMKQWIDSIKKFLDLWKYREIGQIGAGKFKIKTLTVATFQSLDNLTSQEWEILNDKFGCIIFDEVHRVSAVSLHNIANKSKAKYRYGVTATIHRKDKKQFLVFDSISYKFVTIKDEELANEGRLVSANVEFVKLFNNERIPKIYRWNGNSRVECVNWAKLYTNLSNNKFRNEIIINKIIETANKNHFCLVLSKRVDHCENLFNLLKNRNQNVTLFVGTIKNQDRQKLLKNIRQGLIKIVVATENIAAEGLDIPILSCIHLTMPTSNVSFLKQATGRIRRVYENKITPLIIDYVDCAIDKFYNMVKIRKRFYENSNFKILNDCE